MRASSLFRAFKVGRLLKRAKEEGIVEINVRYHPVFSTRLEQQLLDRFPQLQRALIALDRMAKSSVGRWRRWYQPILRKTSRKIPW